MSPSPRPWRGGTKVPRNLYDANGVGLTMMPTEEDARLIVAAVNAHVEQPGHAPTAVEKAATLLLEVLIVDGDAVHAFARTKIIEALGLLDPLACAAIRAEVGRRDAHRHEMWKHVERLMGAK